MKVQRTVKFKVCAIKQHTDMEWVLYDSTDYKVAEEFALSYVGEHKEVFIKKVFELSSTTPLHLVPGSEL